MVLKKSDVTRMAMKKFLDEFNEKNEKPFSKIKHLIGVAESGIPDLGQRHRDYLIKKSKLMTNESHFRYRQIIFH